MGARTLARLSWGLFSFGAAALVVAGVLEGSLEIVVGGVIWFSAIQAIAALVLYTMEGH